MTACFCGSSFLCNLTFFAFQDSGKQFLRMKVLTININMC